jgi:hypothetical protein
VAARNISHRWKTLLALCVLLLWAGSASAYIGPGAGLDLIGYALAMGGFAMTAFFAVLLWPLNALLRRIRGGKNKTVPATPTENVPEEARAKSSTDT